METDNEKKEGGNGRVSWDTNAKTTNDTAKMPGTTVVLIAKSARLHRISTHVYPWLKRKDGDSDTSNTSRKRQRRQLSGTYRDPSEMTVKEYERLEPRTESRFPGGTGRWIWFPTCRLGSRITRNLWVTARRKSWQDRVDQEAADIDDNGPASPDDLSEDEVVNEEYYRYMDALISQGASKSGFH